MSLWWVYYYDFILFLFTLCTFFIYNVYILSINIMEYDLFWTNNAILYGNKEWFVMVVISVKLRGLVFHLIQACDTEFILNRKITFWVWYNVIVIDNWNSISSILFTVSYDFGCYILKLLGRISFTTNIQLILYNVSVENCS